MILENKFNLTSESLQMPFIINGTPIGAITDIDDKTCTINIFDRFIGFEMTNEIISALYFSNEQQRSYEEFMKMKENNEFD